MKKIQIILLGCAFLASGCTLYNIRSEETAAQYYPPRPSANEVVYAETVSKPHEVIGYVTVNAERNQKMAEIIQKMKREAAILGGDAITDISSNATGAWKRVPPQKFLENAYIRANFNAKVIAYR